ncbi:hypothetical protein [Mastigocoleus testarum]|nr:hypothetical protein [Mastigocoleus testarum]
MEFSSYEGDSPSSSSTVSLTTALRLAIHVGIDNGALRLAPNSTLQ